MFVQKELREKNIAEYLLYMWQVEDMIRAAGLDSDRLYDAVIKVSGRSDDEPITCNCIFWTGNPGSMKSTVSFV